MGPIMTTVRVRFAPSPTGYLHVGNVRTALFNWLFARRNEGAFILRIEDTDRERSSIEYEKGLIENLRWLGLDWDEGPDRPGPHGPYRQSERRSVYDSFTDKLLEEGKAYYCFCSPEELESRREAAVARGDMPVYDGTCRGLDAAAAEAKRTGGTPAAVRLKTPRSGHLTFRDLVRGELSFDLKLTGDPVLVRSTGLPAYNYAVVVDDALMKISHVIRGEDHISNTPRQILAYQALGFTPPVFAHLSMVMGPDNTRLSKRHGATSVDQFIDQGILPEALFNYLALLGWAPPDDKEILDSSELTALFRLKKVSRSAAVFDYDKLSWVNRQHMARRSPESLAELALPFLNRAGLMPGELSPEQRGWLEEALSVLGGRAGRAADFPELFEPFFDFSVDRMDPEAKEVLGWQCAKRVIKAFSARLEAEESFDYDRFAVMAKEIKEETGCRGKELFKPLRVALTASGSGLDLDKFIPLVEAGARLSFPRPLKNCAARAAEIAAMIDEENDD